MLYFTWNYMTLKWSNYLRLIYIYSLITVLEHVLMFPEWLREPTWDGEYICYESYVSI